jgi:hypothetical protein
MVWRLVSPRLVEPDGEHCPICGYTITHLPRPVCPECGNAFDPASLRPETASPVALSRRRRRVRGLMAAMVVGLIVAGAVCYLTMYRGVPAFALWDDRYWSYCLTEGDSNRASAFDGITCRLVNRARAGTPITPAAFRAMVGDPDYYDAEGSVLCYIYITGKDGNQETYVDFVGGQLSSIGWNSAGVNDRGEWTRFGESPE